MPVLYTDSMETFSAYLPIDRRLALVGGDALPDRAHGAVLFADISGFTALTGTLAHELGPQRGAEMLTRELDRVCNALISRVHEYGGSVIGISGDAITCWFDDRPIGAAAGAEAGVRRATACAVAIQETMGHFEAVHTPAGTVIALGVKVVITAGSVRRFMLGSSDIQSYEVLAGSLLDRMAAAESLAGLGEIVVGAEVLQEFEGLIETQEWRVANDGERFALITPLPLSVPGAPWPEMPDVPADMAREWLPAPVFRRLERGESAFLAELRPTVTLFTNFRGINYDDDDAAGEKLDRYITWVQSVLTGYEGFLLQLTIGDKGSYWYAVFGALVSHENDPARAISAALILRSPPAEFDYVSDIKIGISRGTTYTGSYGGSLRRTFGVQGNETNIAARLMGEAESGQILVSSQITAAAGHAFEFEDLGPVQVKGVADPLPVFAVKGRRREAQSVAGTPLQSSIVGRDEEQSLLISALEALEEGQSRTVVIEGEAGIGKSRLLAVLLDEARSRGRPFLFGAGDAIEQSTAYFAWRPVMRELLALGEQESLEAVEERLAELLPDDQKSLKLAPLLDAVLPLNLAENELTEQMSGEARATSTRNLLLKLLDGAIRDAGGLLLAIEDAHWLDSASWALITQAQRTLSPLCLVVATRPLTDESFRQVEYGRLLAAEAVEHLTLDRLTGEQTDALISQRLGVSSVPKEVAALIEERAEGHPFFSEEIVFALKEAGHIVVEGGRARMADGGRTLQELDFPVTIQGVITSRIDRLDTPHQLSLKVGSIIGRIFPYIALREIYPVHTERDILPQYLDRLERIEILVPAIPDPGVTYAFKHSITQEVVYNLMTFAQRKQLHHEAAAWYERIDADLSPYYPLLAYHWSKAEETEKAIDYLELAGEQAMGNFAYEEAITFFTQALELESSAAMRSLEGTVRRARWFLSMGEAYVHWTRYVDGRQSLEEGLRLLDRAVPASTTTIGKASSLLGAMLRQIIHRVRGGAVRGVAPAERDILLSASRAYARLVEVYYHSGETLLSTYAAFHSLNLAEKAGDSPELAEAAAPIGAFFSFLRLHNVADAYLRRAVETAEKVNSLPALSYVLLVKCTYESGKGDWTNAAESARRLAEIGQRIGSQRRYNDGVQLQAILLYTQSKFEDSIEKATVLLASAKELNDLRFQVYALFARAYSYLYLGQAENVMEHLAELEDLLTGDGAVTDEQMVLNLHGLASLTHMRLGNGERALESAGRAAQLTVGFQNSHYTLPGFVGPAEVYLAGWEAERGNQELKAAAARVVKALNSFGSTFRIGRPYAWLYLGMYHWLAGKRRKALRAWDKALTIANELEMPYEKARIQFEVGRLYDHDPATCANLLRRAHDGFEEMGAAYDVARARAELERFEQASVSHPR